MELFLTENINALFRKWYCSGDGIDHWSVEIYVSALSASAGGYQTCFAIDESTISLKLLSETINFSFVSKNKSFLDDYGLMMDIQNDVGDTIFKVLKMLRGLLVAGAGSRDIPIILWDLFLFITLDARSVYSKEFVMYL